MSFLTKNSPASTEPNIYLNIVVAVLVGVVLSALHVEPREGQLQDFAVGSGKDPLTVELLFVVPVPVEVQAPESFRFTGTDRNTAAATLVASVGEPDSGTET